MNKQDVKRHKKEMKDIQQEINALDIPETMKQYYLYQLKGKKKDVTAYNCYLQKNLHKFAVQFPDNQRKDIIKMIGKTWKNLLDFEKKQYQTQAAIANLQRAEQAKIMQKQNQDINSQTLNIQKDLFNYCTVRVQTQDQTYNLQNTISKPKVEKRKRQLKMSQIACKLKQEVIKKINKKQKQISLSELNFQSKRINKIRTLNICGQVRQLNKSNIKFINFQSTKIQQVTLDSLKTDQYQESHSSDKSSLFDLVQKSSTYEKFISDYYQEYSHIKKNSCSLNDKFSQPIFCQDNFQSNLVVPKPQNF